MNELTIKKQETLSHILNNILNKRTNVHGYILYGQEKEKLTEYSLLLSKILICNLTYQKDCSNCNICKRIDNNNYSELKIINPINNIIKKEEVLDLKNNFITEPVEGKNLVYIIKDADLLNESSANAILKFLEEPDGKIIGIFTTTDINCMRDTIISRCQVIRLNNEKENINELLNEEDTKYLLSFIEELENDSKESFCDIKEKFIKRFNNKELLKKALNLMIIFYKTCLDYKIINKIEYFSDYIDIIKKISDKDVYCLTKKISFILENIEKIDYNVNVQLFMANFIIEMGEI